MAVLVLPLTIGISASGAKAEDSILKGIVSSDISWLLRLITPFLSRRKPLKKYAFVPDVRS